MEGSNLIRIFKNLAKCSYKYIISNIFKIFYGSVKFKQKNNLHIKTLDHSVIKKKNNKSYKIYIIKKGRVCTDSVEQVAYIYNNSLVKEVCYTQISGKLVSAKKNFVIKKGTPYLKKYYPGNIVSLAQGASGDKNYFHWMFDILPKIKIVLSSYNINEINYFYMPELQIFQKKILSMLGFKKIKIINSKKFKHIQTDNLIIPEHPWYSKSTIFNQVNELPIWISKWLRSSFLNRKKNKKISKFYIDRSETLNKHCQIINNEDIKDFLKSKGFKSIKVGSLSFEDQIGLFNSAKIIIGPHGAAFTNLIFCKKGTKIIEIKPKDRPNNYKYISKLHNLKYKQIITPKVKNVNEKGDMYLSIKSLSKYV